MSSNVSDAGSADIQQARGGKLSSTSSKLPVAVQDRLSRSFQDSIKQAKTDIEGETKQSYDPVTSPDDFATGNDNQLSGLVSDTESVDTERSEEAPGPHSIGGGLDIGGFISASSGDLIGATGVAGYSSVLLQEKHSGSAMRAVANFLQQADNAFALQSLKTWRFEWLQGKDTGMVLLVNQQRGGFTATLRKCSSEFFKDEFLSELNRRLEEKSYSVTLISDEQ